MTFTATVGIGIIKQAKSVCDAIGIGANQQCNHQSKGSSNGAKRKNGHYKPPLILATNTIP